MKTPHLLAYAMATPWAMMPERMAAYAAVLIQHYAGSMPTGAGSNAAEAFAAEMQAVAAVTPSARGGGIAIVPVAGAMVEWPSQIDMCEGGTSTRQVMRALREAQADPSVGAIIMPHVTPGGSVYGMVELGDVINEVKQTKPVYGIAQSLAASAGYWSLTQCTEAYCSPSGEVGSIGVYSGHQNVSKAMEMAGIEWKLFSAGKFKVEGNPFGPTTPEFEEFQNKRAADYYTMFTKAVAKGRRVSIEAVRNGMGEGRVLGAQDALKENMIDGVMGLDELVAKVQKDLRAGSSARRSNRAAAFASAQADIQALS
jgi:signal peptide peptidase SppA